MGTWVVIDRSLIILASAEGLTMGIQHVETKHLKGQRNQFGEFEDARIFLMQEDQYSCVRSSARSLDIRDVAKARILS